MLQFSLELHRRLVDQAYAAASFAVRGANQFADLELVEEVCEHVAEINGYQGEDVYWVSAAIFTDVCRKLGRDQSRTPRPVDDAPE